MDEEKSKLILIKNTKEENKYRDVKEKYFEFIENLKNEIIQMPLKHDENLSIAVIISKNDDVYTSTSFNSIDFTNQNLIFAMEIIKQTIIMNELS